MTGNRPWNAARTLLAAAAITAPPIGLLLFVWAGPRAAQSAAVGFAVATLLGLGGTALAAWAFDKPQNTFLAALVGGFIGKLILFGAALALLILRTSLPPAAFLGGLFGYYVLYQILEIRTVQRLGKARSAGA